MTLALIIGLQVIWIFLSAVFIVAACMRSSQFSQQLNLEEEYPTLEEPTFTEIPTRPRASVKAYQ